MRWQRCGQAIRAMKRVSSTNIILASIFLKISFVMINHSSMELKIKFNEMVTGGWESFSYKLKTENNSISLKTAKQSLLQGSVIIISSDCIHTKMEILDSQQYL